MRAFECPACGYGFVKRHRRVRCRHCSALLLHDGDRFRNNEGDRAFLWFPKEREWRELTGTTEDKNPWRDLID